jgi:hypothetical protein
MCELVIIHGDQIDCRRDFPNDMMLATQSPPTRLAVAQSAYDVALREWRFG